jgi:hypothetical protein
MRADFYGQCASYPGLRAAIADHQSLIGPLSEEELREAIESPAQLAGGELVCRATVFRGNGAGSAAHYFVGTGAWGTA